MTQSNNRMDSIERMPKLERPAPPSDSRPGPDALERHYSLHEVARLWGISREYARRLFRGRPGVLHLRKPGISKRREYITLRIPASVLQEVHRELREVRRGLAGAPDTADGPEREQWLARVRRRASPAAESNAPGREPKG